MKTLNIKRLVSSYLSSWTILGMDALLSVTASVVAVCLVALFHFGLLASAVVPLSWAGCSLVASLLAFWVIGTYRNAIRHTTLREVGKLLFSVIVKEGIMVGAFFCIPFLDPLESLAPALVVLLFLLDFILAVAAIVLVRVLMVVIYDRVRTNAQLAGKYKRSLIYGIGDKSVALAMRLEQSPHYNVVGFLAPNTEEMNGKISGKQVFKLGSGEISRKILKGNGIEAILFAKEKDARKESQSIVKMAADAGIGVYVAPSIDEVVNGNINTALVREIKIEDLLGRDEIKISLDEIKKELAGKVVLVTGAAGSIGSELCRQLATFGVKELVMFDNAETPMHNVRLEFEDRFPDLKFTPVIGDVRMEERLDYVFRTHLPQYVFHAAAYKHVPLMEENPCEAVLVNVHGTRNVAQKCIEYGVEKMVMISTDKAVNPTNIMGCTKRLAEIYVQSLGAALSSGEEKGATKFVTTRFGNVLGSNGSVIPRFREQIAKGGPVTVTHPEITRFFMTIPEACRLVMEAATMTTGNQIFVFDMGKSVRIADLARRMIELAGLRPGEDIKIEYTGLRPGEKLYEEVLSDHENTDPTSHDRIRVARVREYKYADAVRGEERLTSLSREVDIPGMVKLMKVIVPEFISKHSPYEIYDK